MEVVGGGQYVVKHDAAPPKLHTYWALESFFGGDEQGVGSPEMYVERYADLLEQAVHQRLTSDVPIGMFLSGGLDSQYDKGVSPWFTPMLLDGYDASIAPDGRAPFHQEMAYSANVLQNYNLWHEDRTAASQGIEARVPFLDHRLVEYLASIPPSMHSELFFNKAIARRAATRWLPEHLCKRDKVGFFVGADKMQIVMRFGQIIMSVFPDFYEEYLLRDTFFDAAVVKLFYDNVLAGKGDPFRLVPKLGAAISVAIFQRMCDELAYRPGKPYQPTNPLRPPSPQVAMVDPNFD